ncbi:unnamed protein product [Closterium sp. Naga37s-1]|nr:unnamed protein product [Closterium sp. Naga37s-1]
MRCCHIHIVLPYPCWHEVQGMMCKTGVTLQVAHSESIVLFSALPTPPRNLLVPAHPKEQQEAPPAEEPGVADAEEIASGYAASSAQLHHARKTEEDQVKDKTSDARQYLTVGLGALTAMSPGWFGVVIQQGVSAANREALAQFCAGYGVTFA